MLNNCVAINLPRFVGLTMLSLIGLCVLFLVHLYYTELSAFSLLFLLSCITPHNTSFFSSTDCFLRQAECNYLLYDGYTTCVITFCLLFGFWHVGNTNTNTRIQMSFLQMNTANIQLLYTRIEHSGGIQFFRPSTSVRYIKKKLS